MNRISVVVLLLISVMGARMGRAQAIESARAPQTGLQAGGMFSVFQPDFNGDWPSAALYPVAGSGSALAGAGVYVDAGFTRWFGIEAEGRWLRWNGAIKQSNYLIGPKIPITSLGRYNIYGKALVGGSKMSFGVWQATGSFTTIALGGGAERRVGRKLNLRVIDFEYQDWPKWGNSSLKPYGVSAGVAYKIF
jgi:hypothetical protein